MGQLELGLDVLKSSLPPVGARVVGGFRNLDQIRTRAWRGNVDWPKLDMGNEENNLLAQLFGSFDDGIRILDLKLHQAVLLGYIPASPEEEYALTRQWRSLMRTVTRRVSH